MASAVSRKSCLAGQAVFDTRTCRANLSSRAAAHIPVYLKSSEPVLSRKESRLCGPFLPIKDGRLRAARFALPQKRGLSVVARNADSTEAGPAAGASSELDIEDTRTSAASLAEDTPSKVRAFLSAHAFKLPRLLCLAALCALLLPSRNAWAANAALVRPASYARYGLLTALSRFREALRVASAAELLASAWTGLVAGCLHTLTGPDHLAALAPMSIGRTRLQSAWMGALWGCGHDAGQLLFGLLFLLLKDRLHMDLLSQWSGVVIGVTLCGIGALGLHESRQLRAEPPSIQPAYAGISDVARTEEVRPEEPVVSAPKASSSKPFGVATFVTGIFHGFQPDALIMILPALALPSKLAGASFLVTFLLGTILAMGSYTACIGASCEMLGERVPWINEKLSQVSSSISIFVGLALISSNAFGFKVL